MEGQSFAPVIRGEAAPAEDRAVLIQCVTPFGEWTRERGGQEYRGIRTVRYTYARNLEGPWLLYDNEKDPYQMDNLIGRPEHAAMQGQLEAELQRLLNERRDAFLPGSAYIERWGYVVDPKTGTVPYSVKYPSK